MAAGSGLGSQIGWAEESSWGTGVTVTRFTPYESESLKWNPKAVQGQGLQAAAGTELGQLRANTAFAVAGDVQLDFTSKQMGLFLKHCLGAIATAQNGATAAYTHTATIGSTVNGKGLTVQVGRPQRGGTVTPYTYSGCKVTSWELACATADILKFKMSLVGQNRTTATALASASYPTASNVFHFLQGAVTVNGSSYLSVRDFTLTGDNGLKTDDYTFGNAGLINEPVPTAFTKLNIKANCDFADTTITAAYAADTECTMVLTFGGAGLSKQIVTGGTNYYETLVITLAGLRLNGDEPTVGGPDMLSVALDADILIPNAGGSQISVAYTTLDTTP